MTDPLKIDQPDLSIDEALALLTVGKVTEVYGILPWGSNFTFLVKVCHENVDALAVYKPRDGERPLWDFPQGTLCQRETAAFEVSELLGWRIVPATVLREGPRGPGSIQYFTPHDPDQNYFTFHAKYTGQIRRVALFDCLINNADRKGGHCLLGNGEHIWAIDHGLTFHSQPKLRTVIWDFAGKPIPDDLLDDLEALCAAFGSEAVERALADLISQRELAAFEARTMHLLETRTFPYPGAGRSHPWPPV
jgi:uncharacterized repeat protein (TIGR03843 family)